jgi:hypothetical protein
MQQLFPPNISTPAIDIDPQEIKVRQVSTSVIVDLQPQMSKAVWRPAPGRKLGFLIEHKQHLLGIAFLASPVINMKPRDKHLGLSSDPTEKGKQLRHYADLSVCVPSQPFGWHWNGGKLVALIATTLGDAWLERYGDNLNGICTTSLWGRGSQYNRIYKFLGYTQGFGHEHITDETYKTMMDWMTTNNIPIPSARFGQGSNARMRRISAYRKASGDKTVHLRHGNKRGIYYHQANEPHKRQEIIANWYNRWGKPRFDRTNDQTPPYTDGLSNKEPQ